MSSLKIVGTTTALVIVFIGSWLLKNALQSGKNTELIVLLIGALLGVLSIIGISTRANWSWPLMTVTFAGLLLNAVILFASARRYLLTFLLTIAFGVIGTLWVNSRDENDELQDDSSAKIEAYHAEEDEKENENKYKRRGKPGRKPFPI